VNATAEEVISKKQWVHYGYTLRGALAHNSRKGGHHQLQHIWYNASHVPWTQSFPVPYHAIDLGFNGTHGEPFSSQGDRYFSIQGATFSSAAGKLLLGFCLFFRSHSMTHQTCSENLIFSELPQPIFTDAAAIRAGRERGVFTNFSPLPPMDPLSAISDETSLEHGDGSRHDSSRRAAVLLGYGGSAPLGIVRLEARHTGSLSVSDESASASSPQHASPQHASSQHASSHSETAAPGTAPAVTRAPLKWQLGSQPVLTPAHPGCLDLKLFHTEVVQRNVSSWNASSKRNEEHSEKHSEHCYFPSCGCRFDSQLSTVSFRRRVLLYARANMAPHGGARYVQVSSRPATSVGALDRAEARAEEWGPFHLVTIIGYAAMISGNIYTFTVNRNPVDGDTLIALCPVQDPIAGRSAIALSFSINGLLWSPLLDLIKSPDAGVGRTLDHPVDGILRRGNEVLFFVQHRVPGVWHNRGAHHRVTAPPSKTVGLVGYSVPVEVMTRLTERAKQMLRDHVV